MMINKNGPMPSFSELQKRYDQKIGRDNPLGMRISKELDQVSQPKLAEKPSRGKLPKSAPSFNYVNKMNESFLKRLNLL